MNDELKRRLYDYEANPPETLWNRIVVSLDDEINSEFPQKLYGTTVSPPPDSWNKIAKELETGPEEYPSKLFNLEIAPPPSAWRKISTALNEEKNVHQIPRRRIALLAKYAGAACLLGITVFGGYRILKRKTTNQGLANETVAPQKKPPNIIPPDTQKNSSLNKATVLNDSLPTEATVTALASGEAIPQKYSAQQVKSTPQIVNLSSIDNSITKPEFQQVSLHEEIPGNCSLISDTDPYSLFMNPDGYLIRISKKLAQALGCVYTREDSEKSQQCEDQIQKWRDKIAQSPATSSPDNFMDILNIIRSVQEN